MTREKSLQDAEVLIQRLPSDMGIHRNPRKGTLNAPEEILEEFTTEKKILTTEVFPNEFSLDKTQKKILENTEEFLEYSKPLLSVGGDHSVSFPVIKALKKTNPGMKLVWIDSHLDLKKKVGENVSHDVVVRELLDEGFSIDEIYFVGITEMDEDEKEFLEDKDASIFGPSEIGQFLRVFNSDEQPVYLSVDIDVLREEQAPGTGYPDGELELSEVLDLVEEISPDYGDLVEVAPPLDKDERTLENARNILKILVEELSQDSLS